MNSKFSLNRRTFLRGVSAGVPVAVAMPTLEGMLNGNATAFAQGGDVIPKRFMVFFWGNGVKKAQWIPSSTGTGWTPPESMQPFADAGTLDYVSLATNMNVPFSQKWAHHSSYKGMWCGAEAIYDGQGYPAQYGGPKFDDVIEAGARGKTTFSNLAVQIRPRSPGNVGYLNGNIADAKYNPQAMFDKMFAIKPTTGAGASAALAGAVAARKSMLDAVASDATDLKAKLGAADKARVDEHLQRIKQIEKNLSELKPLTCTVPARPDARPADMSGNREPIAAMTKAQSDLMALALACDLTRVVRFTLSGLQTDTIFWEAGLNMGHHGAGHETKYQPQIQKTIVFFMQQLAYLTKVLKGYKVPGAFGAGTLLDQTLIYGTSEQEDPQSHSPSNIPSLLIGRAGGALKGGVHYSGAGQKSPVNVHTRVLMTMMKAMGVPQQSFGKGAGLVTDSIRELET